MKTIVTIDKGKNVKLERYEGELKAGERSTTFEVFLKAMLAECEPEFILGYLVERKEELRNILSNANPSPHSQNSFEEFKAFIKIMIESLYYMRNHEAFQDLALDILKNLNNTKESKEVMEKHLLDFYSSNRYNLDENENLVKLTKSILLALIRKDNPKSQELIMQTLIPYVKSLKDKDVIEQWYRYVIQNVDINILAEESKNRLTNHNQNYGFTTLPKGCIAVSMNDRGSIYVMEVPKSQFRVKLFNVPYEDVGHPRLVFVIHFDQSKQVVTQIYCAAVKEHEVINEETELCKYPYSNVYNNGAVCWSDYPKDFNAIGMLPSLFLSSANNNHLCRDVRALFEKNENRVFDDKQLIPLDKKLKEFL